MTSRSRLARFSGRIGAMSMLGLASCRTAGFKQVFMSLDEAGDRKRTTFFADTNDIFCTGELVSGRADVTVQSTIRANTLYDPASDSEVPAAGLAWFGEVAPGKSTDTMVSFKLLKTAPGAPERDLTGLPYPVGTFTCELAIDGEREDSVDFSIVFADCPLLPPTDGQTCGGFFRSGSSCVGVGVAACVCDARSGAWQCD